MTDKYIKTGGKVYMAESIDVTKKLAALADTKAQLEAQLADCNAEIAELNGKK